MKVKKFAKWRQQITEIDYEMRDLRSFRQHSRVFWWAAQYFPELFEDGSIFAGHIYKGEESYFYMAVRRLVRPQGDATSLVGVLGSFLGELYPLAKECFPELPTEATVREDCNSLVSLCQPVMDFVDKAIAHNDPSPIYDLWESVTRLTPAVNLTIETASKYVGLCTEPLIEVGGSSLDDLRDLYGRKWVPNGLEIPPDLLQ